MPKKAKRKRATIGDFGSNMAFYGKDGQEVDLMDAMEGSARAIDRERTEDRDESEEEVRPPASPLARPTCAVKNQSTPNRASALYGAEKRSVRALTCVSVAS